MTTIGTSSVPTSESASAEAETETEENEKEKKVSRITRILEQHELLIVNGSRIKWYDIGRRNPYSEDFIGLNASINRGDSYDSQ